MPTRFPTLDTDFDEDVPTEQGLKYYVFADEVKLAPWPCSSSYAADAIADGYAVPLHGMNTAEVYRACAEQAIPFEIVAVQAWRERVTGQETDAERFEGVFLALREKLVAPQNHSIAGRVAAAVG